LGGLGIPGPSGNPIIPGDPLPGGEPVGFDDDRGALGSDVGLRRGGIAKPAIGGGGHAFPGAQILHETLRAFERGGGRTRPEGGDPGGFERGVLAGLADLEIECARAVDDAPPVAREPSQHRGGQLGGVAMVAGV